MEINIRNSIIDNFRNSSNEELHKTINDAIKLSEEKNHLINKLSTALKN